MEKVEHVPVGPMNAPEFMVMEKIDDLLVSAEISLAGAAKIFTFLLAESYAAMTEGEFNQHNHDLMSKLSSDAYKYLTAASHDAANIVH